MEAGEAFAAAVGEEESLERDDCICDSASLRLLFGNSL
jgi:hypothetical protein